MKLQIFIAYIDINNFFNVSSNLYKLIKITLTLKNDHWVILFDIFTVRYDVFNRK